MTISNQQIELFQSLFKGREDIYGRRWENENREGYMPAYNVDWDRYEKHKALGGTFQNFKHKELSLLTPAVIRKHLSGKETVGIYSLLKDNTSWLLAAIPFVVRTFNRNIRNSLRSDTYALDASFTPMLFSAILS